MKYVIIKHGTKYVLKRKISEGFFGAGLFSSKNLSDVEKFANNNNFKIVAVGDIWEV